MNGLDLVQTAEHKIKNTGKCASNEGVTQVLLVAFLGLEPLRSATHRKMSKNLGATSALLYWVQKRLETSI